MESITFRITSAVFCNLSATILQRLGRHQDSTFEIDDRTLYSEQEWINKLERCKVEVASPLREIISQDVVRRAILIHLQYWSIRKHGNDEESRKFVKKCASHAPPLYKTNDKVETIGECYLRELIVDTLALSYGVAILKEKSSGWIPWWWKAVEPNNAAKVTQLILFRSLRHAACTIEGLFDNRKWQKDVLMNRQWFMYLTERAIHWELTMSFTSPPSKFFTKEEYRDEYSESNHPSAPETPTRPSSSNNRRSSDLSSPYFSQKPRICMRSLVDGKSKTEAEMYKLHIQRATSWMKHLEAKTNYSESNLNRVMPEYSSLSASLGTFGYLINSSRQEPHLTEPHLQKRGLRCIKLLLELIKLVAVVINGVTAEAISDWMNRLLHESFSLFDGLYFANNIN